MAMGGTKNDSVGVFIPVSSGGCGVCPLSEAKSQGIAHWSATCLPTQLSVNYIYIKGY